MDGWIDGWKDLMDGWMVVWVGGRTYFIRECENQVIPHTPQKQVPDIRRTCFEQLDACKRPTCFYKDVCPLVDENKSEK